MQNHRPRSGSRRVDVLLRALCAACGACRDERSVVARGPERGTGCGNWRRAWMARIAVHPWRMRTQGDCVVHAPHWGAAFLTLNGYGSASPKGGGDAASPVRTRATRAVRVEGGTGAGPCAGRYAAPRSLTLKAGKLMPQFNVLRFSLGLARSGRRDRAWCCRWLHRSASSGHIGCGRS